MCCYFPRGVRGKGVPPVFVSVASKGFSLATSLLFATLAGRPISVAGKGLMRQVEEEREEKPPMGTSAFAARGCSVQFTLNISTRVT